MNEKSEHTDLFGRAIKPGDYIAYSGSEGRCPVIRIGQVIELKTVVKDKWKDEPTETVAKVFCKSWSNFRSEGFSWGEDADKEKSGRQKNVTLGFLTRVVVIDPSTVSEKVKKDLDGPICDYRGLPIK